MATVFLGYRRTAYDRLSASWKGNYWSVLCRTNIHITRCHEAETLTKVGKLSLRSFTVMTMHQRTSRWLLSKLSTTVNLFNWAILPIVQTAPSDCFLIRNLKYHLHGAWFADDESLMIAVEAWESKQENLFSGRKQLRRKVEKNALMLQENMSKNDSM